MYHPYLRGKQYELIALRELIEKGLIGDKVIPIVEPIKASPFLLSFMFTYTKGKSCFGIVQNPEFGKFIHEMEGKIEYKKQFFSFFIDEPCCLPVFIFNKRITQVEPFPLKQKAIAICTEEDIVSFIPELSKKHNVDKFLIPDVRIFKREINGDKILLSDNFKKLPRNADYANSVDDFFSDDHLFFEEEGYKGFSDFSIIGREYTESGFAPYAVAIHMVYFDTSKKLRVYHFVSDSNDDYDDPQGKLEEALKKLVNSPLIDNTTYAYQELKNIYDKRTYSGLGVIKKLSLMHHIEIVSRYLQERK